jgi:hypothetical protein
MTPSTFNVYFAVFGDWSEPAAVTSMIGRDPDEFFPKGSMVGSSKRVRKRSMWRIASGREASEPIEQHLEALLGTLERYAEGVRRVASEHEAGINCAAYWRTSQPGFHLSETIVARVSALRLSLDFDMYCLDDDEESD